MAKSCPKRISTAHLKHGARKYDIKGSPRTTDETLVGANRPLGARKESTKDFAAQEECAQYLRRFEAKKKAQEENSRKHIGHTPLTIPKTRRRRPTLEEEIHELITELKAQRAQA